MFKQNSGKWAAANYRWNTGGTDANLVTETVNETVLQYFNGNMENIEHTVRGGAECTSCHIGTGSIVNPVSNAEVASLQRSAA